MVREGDKAPDFALPTESGETLSLSGLIRQRSKPVVVYFYPKDDTTGCTAEAKDFTRLAPDFERLGIEVIGNTVGYAFHDRRAIASPLVRPR